MVSKSRADKLSEGVGVEDTRLEDVDVDEVEISGTSSGTSSSLAIRPSLVSSMKAWEWMKNEVKKRKEWKILKVTITLFDSEWMKNEVKKRKKNDYGYLPLFESTTIMLPT